MTTTTTKKKYVYISRPPMLYDEDTFYCRSDKLTFLDTEYFKWDEEVYY